MTTIESVAARRAWDTSGLPTEEVDVRLNNGKLHRPIAPAGDRAVSAKRLICAMATRLPVEKCGMTIP